jgi:hypothetical protein
MSSLSTPALEDQKSYLIRRSFSKQSKLLNRTLKGSNSLYEHGAMVINGRHRVQKACERCRMKKTKVSRRGINLFAKL